jgi:hypothetical protein
LNRIAGMTGPEHFLAGEELLSRSELTELHRPEMLAQAQALAAQAQAHFAAAQTLAFGLMAADGASGAVADSWRSLLGLDKADTE